MNEALLKLILILHTIFVLFVIFTPFIGSNYFLLLHCIIVPFVMLHWVLNDNTCALTLIEKKLREKLYGTIANNNDCFTCRLIEPVYDFKGNYDAISELIYLVTTLLFSISGYKLYTRYTNGEIASLKELFRM